MQDGLYRMSDESLLVQNGMVIDGTGAAPVHADVLIENGRVAEVIPHPQPPSTAFDYERRSGRTIPHY